MAGKGGGCYRRRGKLRGQLDRSVHIIYFSISIMIKARSVFVEI